MTTCQDIIRVDTNTPGYSLLFKTSSSTLNHTSITGETILATSNGTTPAQLGLNSWGFAVPSGATADNTAVSSQTLTGFGAFDSTYTQRNNAVQPSTTDKYATVPTSDTSIKQLEQGNANNNTVVADDRTTVFFGASADMALMAGQYTTTITYTAVGAEIPEPESIACQSGPQFKGAIGNISTYNFTGWNIGDTGIATDTRNGQQYCVGKLADENIWMLNNLRIADFMATSANTDLNTIGSFMIPSIDTSGNSSYDDPLVYSSSAATNHTGDYETADPTSDHFGGYLYNWSAATAGETSTSMPGDGTNGDIAPNSICPKNWRLPKVDNYGIAFDPSNDFDQLNAKMAGFLDNQDVNYQAYYGGDGYTGFTDQQFYNNWQFSGPFRGVDVGFRDGGWWEHAAPNLFWSSVSYTSSGAIDASFGIIWWDSSTKVSTLYGNVRNDGFSLRCLLK
jgi:uncharacterized protein (TIGR02145 family)